MPEAPGPRPVGASTLALLSILVSLLGWLAALALVLAVLRDGVSEGILLRILAMVLLGAGFMALAVACFRTASWCRWCCYAMFVVIVVASLMSAAGSGVLELGAVLVLGLAFGVNTAVLVYLRIPSARRRFEPAGP